jgi:phosphatidylglycerophosphate synthase
MQLQVVTSLLLLLFNLPTPWIALPVLAIVLREITVSALREWLAGRNLRHVVQVSSVGKAKTAVQMISLALLLLTTPLPVSSIALQRALALSSGGGAWLQSFSGFLSDAHFEIEGLGVSQDMGRRMFSAGVGLFYVSTVLTVYSGGLYVRAAWPVLTSRDKDHDSDDERHTQRGLQPPPPLVQFQQAPLETEDALLSSCPRNNATINDGPGEEEEQPANWQR